MQVFKAHKKSGSVAEGVERGLKDETNIDLDLSIKVAQMLDWKMGARDGRLIARPAKASLLNVANGKTAGFCLIDWSVRITTLIFPLSHPHHKVEANRAAVWDPDQVRAFSNLRCWLTHIL